MYFRQHGYPTARLISYKITPNPIPWQTIVPLSEPSTIGPRGEGLVYCLHSSEISNGF